MIKPYDQVKPGDIATDYNNSKYPVVETGPIKEMILKYPNQPLAVYDLDHCEIEHDAEAIVVEETEHCLEGYTHIIYTYGYEGAWVEQPEEILVTNG